MEYNEIDIQAIRFLTPDGGTLEATQHPEIRCEMPVGTFAVGRMNFCRVSIQICRSGDCSDWQDIASVIGEERINSAVETGVINIGNVVVSGRFVVVCCDNSIMDVPATVSEMMRSCMNGGLGAAQCSDQPHLDLLHAARNGDVSALKACLTSEGMDINFTNKGGQSALHLACAEGHTHIVKELLKHDADMTLLSQKGNAPIHLACFNGHGDVVELLLKKGCDINLPSKHSCFPPIYASILETHCEVVKLLLSKGADVTWTSLDGLSLVLVAVYTTYDKERTKALLQILLDHVDISTLHLSKQLKHRGFICHGEALLQCVATRQAAKDLIGPVRLKLANHSTDLIHKDLETCQYGLSASNIATEMGYLNIVSIIKDYSIRNEFRKETSQKTVTASSEKDKEKDEKTVKKCCNIV
ncbi:ANK2-like protein [Mya arenaria]|uniref:ANK2-like protein n=1 Tax=Mya arenaria TaxID=6604 RepID=A0ABY7DHG1_MYAAR|nr:ANK2-like protein [Mya arenaria]